MKTPLQPVATRRRLTPDEEREHQRKLREERSLEAGRRRAELYANIANAGTVEELRDAIRQWIDDQGDL